MLLQQTGLFFPFTVEQVVAMGRAPWLWNGPRPRRRRGGRGWALELTDVGPLSGPSRCPRSPGGERARAALARVLAQRTGILLLDEPTAALDSRHQETCCGSRSDAREGDAVLVVLHDLCLAAAYADRVTLLEGGRVVATGPPDEVLTGPRLNEVYGQPVEVLRHPRTGVALILPLRLTHSKDTRP